LPSNREANLVPGFASVAKYPILNPAVLAKAELAALAVIPKAPAITSGKTATIAAAVSPQTAVSTVYAKNLAPIATPV